MVYPDLYDNFLDFNYWLEQWLMYYQFVQRKLVDIENILIISYESLSSEFFVNNLCKALNICRSDLNLKITTSC